MAPEGKVSGTGVPTHQVLDRGQEIHPTLQAGLTKN